MQKENKFFDDIAKMASSAGGTLMDMKREMESTMSGQMEKMLKRMDLVTKEDFNVVRDMCIKARTEQEALIKRVAELEKKLGIKAAAPKAPAKTATKPKPAAPLKTAGTTAKKPAAKKTVAKKAAPKKAAPKKTTTSSGKTTAKSKKPTK